MIRININLDPVHKRIMFVLSRLNVENVNGPNSDKFLQGERTGRGNALFLHFQNVIRCLLLLLLTLAAHLAGRHSES